MYKILKGLLVFFLAAFGCFVLSYNLFSIIETASSEQVMASLQYVNGKVYGPQGDGVDVDRVLAIGKEGFSCRVAGHDGQSISIKEFRYLVSNINIEIPVKKSRLRSNRCWILDQWNSRLGGMLWGFTFLMFAFFASKL